MNELLIFPLLFLLYVTNTVNGCQSCGCTKYANTKNLITCPNGNIEYINGEKYCCEEKEEKDCYKILSPRFQKDDDGRHNSGMKCPHGMLCIPKGEMHSTRRLMLFSDGFMYNPFFADIAGIELKKFLLKSAVKKILFVPYALKNYGAYLDGVREPLENMGFEVVSIHEAADPIDAINSAQAIYVGGGNTFRLLKALYNKNLIRPMKQRVLEDGIPYFGVSAGSNVAATSICTTNDMPILWPPGLKALELIPFNINPHYSSPDTNPLQLETRDYRINQYHEIEGTPPVLALRDGSFLHVEGNVATLKGYTGSKLFIPGKKAKEIKVGADLSFLLK